jgi:hypothetical protein
MWNGPNGYPGTGRITALSSRNLAKVRISPGAVRRASDSSATFSSSSSRLRTARVVATQK